MPESIVTLEFADQHAIITLHRPSRLNALTRDLMVELRAALALATDRADVKVIALTGSGRAFCAGQDLNERDPRVLKEPLDLEAIQKELFHPVIRAIETANKPVVAMVNGIAAGAGAAIALACDLVLMSEDAKLAFSFSKVGLSVDAGLGQVLYQTVGPIRAKSLLMLGETLRADEALALGLASKVYTAENFLSECAKIIAALEATPINAFSGIKSAMASAHLSRNEYLSAEAKAQGVAGRHSDYAEAVLAFLTKG